MMRRLPLFALATPVLAASCVAPPAAPPPRPLPPAMRPTPAPPPAPSPPMANYGVALPPVAPGTWTYASEPHSSTARFGIDPLSMVFSVQCDRMLRAVSLLVARPAGSGGGNVTLRATTTLKSFRAEGGGGGRYAVVRIPSRDPILDALAFSRGRFTVELDGRATVLPTWPEFTRVVEDCRA